MEDKYSYLTLSGLSESEYRDRGSKFFGFAYPVENKPDIKRIVTQLKERFPDATHICYAWVIGDDFRANDDGEPGNSAGNPILRRIRSHNLDRVFVAVVRFYGGKKLGVSGLIEAYGGAAELALSKASTRTEHPKTVIQIRDLQNRDYVVYELQGRLNILNLTPPDQPGGMFELLVYKSEEGDIRSKLESLPNFELTKPK